MTTTAQQVDITPERIMRFSDGYQASQLVTNAVSFHFFTHIGHGVTEAAAIAAAAGTDARATRMVLDGLVALGLLQGTWSRYHLSPDAEQFLVEGKPAYLGDLVTTIMAASYERWSHLDEVLRTGKALTTYNRPEQGAEFFAKLVKGLFNLSFPLAQRLAQQLQQQGRMPAGGKVLDVGAGSAVWSLPLLQQDPAATLVAVDNPLVVGVTRQYAEKLGVVERLSLMEGDFFAQDYPPDTFDVVLLGNICHQENPEANGRLFGLLSRTLKHGGTLVIVDMVPDEDRSGPPYPLLFALTMLINTTSGDTYTLGEYKTWLTAAGFDQVETMVLPGHHSPILLARRD